jgi:hypothetical protein
MIGTISIQYNSSSDSFVLNRADDDSDEEELVGRILSTDELIEKLRNREDLFGLKNGSKLKSSDMITLIITIIAGICYSKFQILLWGDFTYFGNTSKLFSNLYTITINYMKTTDILQLIHNAPPQCSSYLSDQNIKKPLAATTKSSKGAYGVSDTVLTDNFLSIIKSLYSQNFIKTKQIELISYKPRGPPVDNSVECELLEKNKLNCTNCCHKSDLFYVINYALLKFGTVTPGTPDTVNIQEFRINTCIFSAVQINYLYNSDGGSPRERT